MWPVRRVSPGLVLCVALAVGCGASRPARTTPTAPPVGPTDGSSGDDTVVDDGWGLGLSIEPAITRAEVSDRHFVVDTVGRGDVAAGVFRLRAVVDPLRAGAGSAALAAAEREQVGQGGAADPSSISEVQFLGRPAHAFTFRAGSVWALEVLLVVDRCVFELVVMRAGRPEAMTEYAGAVLRNVKPLSGSAVDASRCR
jgi:hypothetical protein